MPEDSDIAINRYINAVHEADSLELLTELPEESVHAIVTDPPYGLAFMGRGWDDFEPKEYQEWCEEWATLALDVLKPGGHLLAFSGNRTHHRLFSGVEDAGYDVRDTLTWHYANGFPKGQDVSKAIDKAERGHPQGASDPTSPNHGRYKTQATEGKRSEADDGRGFGAGPGSYMAESGKEDDRDLTSEDAKRWGGWNTALKPATEFLVLARKPFEGTVAECVQEHGTAALNIDVCRVEAGEGSGNWSSTTEDHQGAVADDTGLSGGVESKPDDNGRYPSNVAFGEQVAENLDQEVGELSSGELKGRYSSGDPESEVYNDGFGGSPRNYDSNSGGPSRYFYTSKATRAERTLDGKIENSHPTVKPVDLMEWLVKLVTAEKQIVLDAFAGSGTTLRAAKNLNRQFIGIEQQAQWCDVARARCGLTPQNPGDLVDDGQDTLADGGEWS